ncbi:MAG: DMT family transporter [Alphaproteobacteria bacterium]|nr:DMT family transporter [Alphaproteobacteria bacterium]
MTPVASAADHRYRWGVAGVVLGAFAASTAGIILRHIETDDGWQVLLFRSLAFAVTIFLLVVARHRGGTAAAFRAIGLKGLAVAAGLGGAFIAFIFALLWTTVAETVFILSASPMFVAAIAWLVLRERISWTMCLSMAAVIVGIGIMVADGLVGGALRGALAALGACLGYAVAVVALRAGRDVDMMPATCLSGVFAFLVCVLLVDDIAIGARDLALSLLLGTGQIGLQYIMITLSTRVVPAAEITLIMMLEVVLAPIWVWVGVGETPSATILLGGAIVVAAVFGQAIHNLRQARLS